MSIDKLIKIYPIKFVNKKVKSDVITANSNKLRSNGSELFVIYRKHNTNDYTEPFNENEYGDISENFNEDSKTRDRMIKDMSRINDTRYEYKFKNKKHLERITLDHLRKYAKKSNSPYIRYDCVYHDEYGIIDTTILNKFNN